MKRRKNSKHAAVIYTTLVILILVGAVFVFSKTVAITEKEIITETKEEQVTIDVTKCLKNSDCDWRSTNCCDEDRGAWWECANLRNFSLECPSMVLCPQISSPKPNLNCICEQESCVAK